MPNYSAPNQYSFTKYAVIGKTVYSFGYDNNTTYPKGPPAPTLPTLTANTSVSNGNLNNANVWVQTVYVFPGSGPQQVNPQTMPMGFASNIANISLSGASNAVVVTSPGPSLDSGNLAIGYNVFAGSNANVITLVNTNAIVPIGTNYTIQNTTQLGAATGGIGYNSSPTPTYTGEVLTVNAGMQFGIPVSSSNFLGPKSLSWRTAFANGTPSSSNIALQGAYVDNANSYVNLDFSTNTAGELRVINPINVNFVRANVITAPANTITSIVSIRID